ncbi:MULTISPECIES: hypothetical protein [unclassified Bradyrhizobium]|uniref:hypothetical protein n=1 Tax=unclassified Bradyrhizobium TaxID=2631580 RepID=UPI001CD53AEE|nr:MULTISPECIES: hypothetical protein [unclassified Bradyrhizobium]MCA1393844.1 hypothetical protein [Bradyrhizobium sp. IC3123]MCA1480129.1 hypothetical protein [Bradyrhizobium sp. NBAIM08]MCA1500258.1 hypothetical protein [Bradyrhizobium sp. NBAIM14]MCA1508685.1 hypothetical protein [Bradyrhizobium sp. NBAIM02]
MPLVASFPEDRFERTEAIHGAVRVTHDLNISLNLFRSLTFAENPLMSCTTMKCNNTHHTKSPSLSQIRAPLGEGSRQNIQFLQVFVSFAFHRRDRA